MLRGDAVDPGERGRTEVAGPNPLWSCADSQLDRTDVPVSAAFAVRDLASGAVLFLGEVTDPSADG